MKPKPRSISSVSTTPLIGWHLQSVEDAQAPCQPAGARILRTLRRGVAAVVKKGQMQVSKMDSPKQGEPRDPNAPKIKRPGGSASGRRGRGQAEGAGNKG